MTSRVRRMILADDHELVRAGIRAIVNGFDNVSVEAETGDGKEAFDLVRRLQPDVLLLDVTLPGLNGLEVAERVARLEHCETRVLMLSMHAGPEYVARALQAGASGYLLKDSAVEELASALEAVLAGRRYLSRGIDAAVVEAFLAAGVGEGALLAVLTPRQREILQLIAEGTSTRDMAERLFVSVKTVETHRAQIMERLGIRDVAGLVRFAIRAGLISPDA